MDGMISGQLIREYFEVPGFDHVYVLGCFAKDISLYAQQVRAFNMIFALAQSGVLLSGEKVAVVGAGAAGLTAAVAARYLGCDVFLVERHDGPLGLQLNNRQRWVYPKINRWPEPGSILDEAALPILDWSAGPADRIAEEILSKWNLFALQHPVSTIWNAEVKSIKRLSQRGCRYRLGTKGSDNKHDSMEVDHVVLAVGFGTEQTDAYSGSYWAEDTIDDNIGDFSSRWLVSGRGDGALTDLMRLCIRRFRHDSALRAILASAGIRYLFGELKTLDESSLDESERSRIFAERVRSSHLSAHLRTLLRPQLPKITWHHEGGNFFGNRRATILNRVVVAALQELGAFSTHSGKMGSIVHDLSGSFTVTLGKRIRRFDRVLRRYGPKPEIHKLFKRLFKGHDLSPISEAWTRLQPNDDVTRTPLWPVGFFGPEGDLANTPTAQRESEYVESFELAGFAVNAVTLEKELVEDGSSVLTIYVNGLEVTEASKELSKLELLLGFEGAKFGLAPRLIDTRGRLGLTWVSKTIPPFGAYTDATQSALNGAVLFQTPLRFGDAPISFAIEATVFNSDPMTQWQEYCHSAFRAWIARTGGNMKSLGLATFQICCPVGTFRLRLRVPASLGFSPAGAVCSVDSPEWTNVGTDFRRDRSLLLSNICEPSNASETSKPRNVNPDTFLLSQSTWEATFHRPPVGSRIKMEWRLPSAAIVSEFETVCEKSAKIRESLSIWKRECLDSRQQSRGTIEAILRAYQNMIVERQKVRGTQESFALRLSTLNEENGFIEAIAEISEDNLSHPDSPDDREPFGAGMSGSAFKSASRLFLHLPMPSDLSTPEIASSKVGMWQNPCVLAIPIDNALWNEGMRNRGFDRARQCVGILQLIGATESPWFYSLLEKDAKEVLWLAYASQAFGEELTRLCENGMI